MFEDHTVWKVSKYGVFSGPYFPPYSVQMQENTDQKKLRIWALFTQCQIHHACFYKSLVEKLNWLFTVVFDYWHFTN